MTLDQVCNELQVSLEDFQLAYRRKHMENPEHYPLELPENNAGLWYEFFITFALEGNL